MLKKVYHVHVVNVCCATEVKQMEWLKTDYIKIKTSKVIKFKKQLNCKFFEIYAAQCNKCEEFILDRR